MRLDDSRHIGCTGGGRIGGNQLHRLSSDFLWNRRIVVGSVIIQRRCDQDGTAAQCIRKVVLDCEDQIAAGQAGSKSLRERVQFADLSFAAAQTDRFILKARREVAGDQSDQQEQNQIDDILRVADPERVKRRIEEEIRGSRAGNGRYDARYDPPQRGGQNNWQYVNQGNEVEGNEIIEDDEADGRQPYQRKRRYDRNGVRCNGTLPPDAMTSCAPFVAVALCQLGSQIAEAAPFVKCGHEIMPFRKRSVRSSPSTSRLAFITVTFPT